MLAILLHNGGDLLKLYHGGIRTASAREIIITSGGRTRYNTTCPRPCRARAPEGRAPRRATHAPRPLAPRRDALPLHRVFPQRGQDTLALPAVGHGSGVPASVPGHRTRRRRPSRGCRPAPLVTSLGGAWFPLEVTGKVFYWAFSPRRVGDGRLAEYSGARNRTSG